MSVPRASVDRRGARSGRRWGATRVVGARPKKGKLILKPNGSFTYKPKKNFNGIVRFVYRASDGKGGSDTATVTLRIKARPG